MSGVTTRLAGMRERPVRLLLTIAAIALAGATAFGLWHLVVGGLINGNPRAGTFGLLLALGAGLPLVVGAGLRTMRSRRRVDGPRD